ncbi:MAG: 3-phosphoshikimate 1-carboxyvinyltransferase 1 [Fimbriimonadales bacterium]|nr:3-phosphoshikimate 1-carboxyvinyltransferase 1 [Fimbriimonadales bacterium]
MEELVASPASRFWGELRPPSDKSITHRAYLIGALAARGALIRKPLRGQDCEDTLELVKALGAIVEAGDDSVRIRPSKLSSTAAPLWCGNSGTTLRLAAGLIAGQGLSAVLTGDESLSKRPMRRIVEPLREMGADIQGDTPPVTIQASNLHGIEYASPIASAQIKSCVLLAGLGAEGDTSVSEPSHSRDHTERMLGSSGVSVRVEGLTVTISPGRPEHLEVDIPADPSSAAFFLVAAAMLGGPLTAKSVCVNPTRSGILDVLAEAGVSFTLVRSEGTDSEPIADICVETKPEDLKPFNVGGDLIPRLIDEIPVLAVLATQCNGTSEFRDARELRVKESDRIEAIASGLRKMGANVEVWEDGFSVAGPTKLHGTTIEAKGDHRIAMSFAVAGLMAEGETRILGAETIRTSFPDFEQELRRLAN